MGRMGRVLAWNREGLDVTFQQPSAIQMGQNPNFGYFSLWFVYFFIQNSYVGTANAFQVLIERIPQEARPTDLTSEADSHTSLLSNSL